MLQTFSALLVLNYVKILKINISKIIEIFYENLKNEHPET